ncbi:MAG: Co2+/Mg2+ efflux protein ApaG [Bacteroidota bacterium]
MTSDLSSQITEGIRVTVRTKYVQDESSPKHLYFVFAYQVEIINESPYSVQLLERQWNIVDGVGGKRLVQGEGVIGKKPILEPGQSHRYVSGCHFPTAIGKMSGHYLMERQVDNSTFKVEIPPFVMMVPYMEN